MEEHSGSSKTDSVEGILKRSHHHAFCFITRNPSEGGKRILKAVSTCWDVTLKENPDLLHYVKGSFAIEDANFLRNWSSVNPAKDSEKVCVLETHTMTTESQNALLKLFESTPRHIRFILIIPSEDILLTTLYSRLAISFLETETGCSVSVDEFLSSTIAVRSKMLKKYIDERDKAGAQMFLDLLEEVIYDKMREGPPEHEALIRFIRTLPAIKKMNADQRVSVKTVLEHVIHFAPMPFEN